MICMDQHETALTAAPGSPCGPGLPASPASPCKKGFERFEQCHWSEMFCIVFFRYDLNPEYFIKHVDVEVSKYVAPLTFSPTAPAEPTPPGGPCGPYGHKQLTQRKKTNKTNKQTKIKQDHSHPTELLV